MYCQGMFKIRNILFLLVVTFLFVPQKAHAISQSELEKAIHKAEVYYESFYHSVGNNMAVVNEYDSAPQAYYTMRHGVSGGIFYYMQTGQFAKAQALTNFARSLGVNPNDDLHSYIWKNKETGTENLFSAQPYYDCYTNMPQIGNELPYHSKVCKFGSLGLAAYTTITRFDPLLITIQQLQNIESGKKVDHKAVLGLQADYQKVGNGMPMCIGPYCSQNASAIRTAEYGELQLRLGNMQEADKVVSDLVKAQNPQGAVFIAYDKKGNLVDPKNAAYTLLDKLYEDKSIFQGSIPSNAETLNDVLAFLLHYLCQKYHVCGTRI